MSTRSFMAGERPTKKPVIPLRYRIDPTAKLLDDLDNLEFELERDRGKIESDLYYDLLEKLKSDRAAIIAKRDKGKPVQEKPTIALAQDQKVYNWISDSITETSFKWLLFLSVLFWILLN